MQSSLSAVLIAAAGSAILAAPAPAEIAQVSRDSRFRLDTDSGNYLRVGGYMQFRYVVNSGADAPDGKGGTADIGAGFAVQRAKMAINGAIADGELEYKIQLRAGSSGGLSLEDAAVSHKYDNGIKVTAGQFKPQYLRGENVSSSVQMTVERSATTRYFTLAYTQGVNVSGSFNDNLKWDVAFTDAARQLNTPAFTETADYAFTGKLRYSPSGEFGRFKNFTSFRGTNDGATDWLFGGALHYQSGGEFAGTTDADLLGWTAEASVEGDGWTGFASVIGQQTEPGTGSDFYDMGIIAQGSYFVTEQNEAFVRFDSIIADDDGPTPDDFSTITAGVNHYFVPGSTAAKVTVDVAAFMAGTDGAPVGASSILGTLPATSGGQVAIRTQLVMSF